MKQGPNSSARASINDVAAHAGVSAQTVSRVANGQNNVRPSTRDRVLASMRELGYRPNSAARNLKSGRFRSIGFVTFNLATLGNERTLDAVTVASESAGYTTTLLSIADPTQLDVAGAFGRLEEQAVDGIILVMSAEVGPLDEWTITAGLPVVIVDSDAELPYTIVDTDQEQGARLALDHLLGLGHRRIVHVSGPQNSYSATRRADAYRRVLEKAALPVPEVLVGDWSAASGLAHGRALIESGEVPTAIFAGNDQMALGVLHALHEAGLRVPDDVSVVGFDDSDEALAFWPALTTVHQNFDDVGRKATESLLALIDGGAVERQKILIPTRLVVRDSTGPARVTA
ncbi:LacI family DNA-binding transcriptional regulator [Agromyces sp. H3Y2-19a]|jgi:DNA-binding LacI/PurR family transcriptional regulator|uniref:LacI family DNA-binding transcriptional regulator n=1 Tax=Agromyces TaxID=33877 RepID=UPI001E62DEAB|nr:MULTISPECIES: LacI family DNA-binding transcriptional regulator [Agromyces]MCD5348058.1 LacI family transcriptional regulator [Agromyces sp. S2-1-8]MDF0514343.1 LacI family DNA-binding transcriptional regulator [Agromyces chromiiresistens]